jgi:hypothetical protein
MTVKKNKVKDGFHDKLVKEFSQNDQEHPEAAIQDEWEIWLNEGPFTYTRYKKFMAWRKSWLKGSSYFKR